jgi:hypothetical protein
LFEGRKLLGRTPSGMLPSQVLPAWEAHSKAISLWNGHLKRRKTKTEEVAQWCRDRQAEFDTKWDLIRRNLLDREASDATVRLNEKQASREAQELERTMAQKVKALRDELAAQDKTIATELEECWRTVPDDVISAWEKVRVSR